MAKQAAPLRELSTTRFIIPTWVVRHSKEVRDEADKRITADPRMQPGPDMPFGGKRRRRRARNPARCGMSNTYRMNDTDRSHP
jgi:hypothetical protein